MDFTLDKKHVLFALLMILLLVVIVACIAKSCCAPKKVDYESIDFESLLPNSPFDYPGTTWVSQDPSITLMIPEGKKVACSEALAFLSVDGEEKQIILIIDPSQRAVAIYPRGGSRTRLYYDDIMLEGTIRHSSETEICFYIIKDNCFSGAYDTITLVRQDTNTG